MSRPFKRKRPSPVQETANNSKKLSANQNSAGMTIVKLDSDVELIAVQQGVHSEMKRAAAACPPGKTRLVVSKIRRLPGIIGLLIFSTSEGWNLFEAEDCPEGRKLLEEFAENIKQGAKKTCYIIGGATCN